MKKSIVLLALIFFSFHLHAQSIIGNWRINTLLINAETEEYILSSTGPEGWNYGNNLELKADGTFVSYYTAPCGNDCFTTTTGKYERVNKTHIQFFLEKITRDGECMGNSEPNLDLGLYAIHFVKDEIRFTKATVQLRINK